MGYTKKLRDRGKIHGGFVPLTWELLNHAAYKELQPSAAKALPYFIGKVKMGPNDPERYLVSFELSYSEGKILGFATATHHRNIKELVAHGFIDPHEKGGLKSGGRSFNRFRLSERWKKYGKPDFIRCDWRTFHPAIKPHVSNENTQRQNCRSS